MTRKNWGKYIDDHGKGICLFGGIDTEIRRIPNVLAKNKKIWPSAHVMLRKALEKELVHDWTSRAEKNGIIHIILSNSVDVANFSKILKLSKNTKNPLPNLCTSSFSFRYDSKTFEKLAKSYGYI